jgi:hypothetical protein
LIGSLLIVDSVNDISSPFPSHRPAIKSSQSIGAGDMDALAPIWVERPDHLHPKKVAAAIPV